MALKMGFNKENTVAFIAESLGVSEPSVKRWFAAFRKGGIEAALQLKSRSGLPSGMDEDIVVWNGAGFHPKDASHEMTPEDVHIVTLPPYSPELNPIEKLWNLIQDHKANKLWPTIERLDQVVGLHLKDWWE